MILLCVEPIQGWNEQAHYIDCCLCYETACEDIWAGKTNEADWRMFYEIVGEGLHVCEHCLPTLTELE